MASLSVEYLGGSGFLVSAGKIGLLFDCSDSGAEKRIMPEKETLLTYDRLYVFVSHGHEAHFSPKIYEICPHDSEFILGYDVPEEYEGKRMKPGDTLEFADLTAEAYDSTDEGVSFLVRVGGLVLFHAGDLNWWHWRDVSTLPEIEESERDFRACVDAIPEKTIDLAFFPVAPRQGSMYDAGAGYFVMAIKPRVLIPMHFQGRPDAARRFALTSGTAYTRIAAMSEAGETMELQFSSEPPEPSEPLPEP